MALCIYLRGYAAKSHCADVGDGRWHCRSPMDVEAGGKCRHRPRRIRPIRIWPRTGVPARCFKMSRRLDPLPVCTLRRLPMQNSTRKIEEFKNVQHHPKTLCPSTLAKLDNPTTINCSCAPSNGLSTHQNSNCLPDKGLSYEMILREFCGQTMAGALFSVGVAVQVQLPPQQFR